MGFMVVLVWKLGGLGRGTRAARAQTRQEKSPRGPALRGDTAIFLGAASTCGTQRLTETAVPHQSPRDSLSPYPPFFALVGMKAVLKAGSRAEPWRGAAGGAEPHT